MGTNISDTKLANIDLDDYFTKLLKATKDVGGQVLAVAVGARPFTNASGYVFTLDKENSTSAEQMHSLIESLPGERQAGGGYAYKADHSHDGHEFTISVGQSDDRISSAATFRFI